MPLRNLFSRTKDAPLALALQGGGAHGAFTWGVLDALLERGLSMHAFSGASAGAMNAVICAQGLINGDADAARADLANFWQGVADRVPPLWHLPGDPPALAPAGQLWLAMTRWWAPSQLNPLGLDPLRDWVARVVDFDRLRHDRRGAALFIAATQAQTGRLRLFRRPDLTLDALMASACLPTLAHPVMIDGQAYWDGGYIANPPLVPLVRETDIDDLMLVTLMPLRPRPLPADAAGIAARAHELSFAAPLLREAAWLAQAQADARGAWFRSARERRLVRLRWHLFDADDALTDLAGETRLLPELSFLHRLRDAGRARVDDWWSQHAGRLGARSSLDALRTFGA